MLLKLLTSWKVLHKSDCKPNDVFLEVPAGLERVLKSRAGRDPVTVFVCVLGGAQAVWIIQGELQWWWEIWLQLTSGSGGPLGFPLFECFNKCLMRLAGALEEWFSLVSLCFKTKKEKRGQNLGKQRVLLLPDTNRSFCPTFDLLLEKSTLIKTDFYNVLLQLGYSVFCQLQIV